MMNSFFDGMGTDGYVLRLKNRIRSLPWMTIRPVAFLRCVGIDPFAMYFRRVFRCIPRASQACLI